MKDKLIINVICAYFVMFHINVGIDMEQSIFAVYLAYPSFL